MIQHPSKSNLDASRSTRRGVRHSIPSGDIALCNLPPYSTQPWLSMGVVLHYGLLAREGFRVRVIRPVDAPYNVPEGVLHASLRTFTFDPSIEARLDAMAQEDAATPEFFDALVDELLAGSERVVGLSLFRNNADVSMHVARRLKARSPHTYVILGGPEAIEEPEALQLPWVDAVVGRDAEAVIVPLMSALLADRPERAAGLPGVWLNPRFSVTAAHLLRPAPSTPPFPAIDYASLVPLLVGDPQATMPLLLNWGCPYRCAFCSNRNVYSRFEQGSVPRVLDEMDAIMTAWASVHDGSPPGISLQLSDATTNVLPDQFDELLDGIAQRCTHWATRPAVRGQSLFDRRITEERVQRMEAGCFTSTFFGLESGSDRLRHALQKPGTVAQVAAAMEAYHRAGGHGLHYGVPVGIPGETDEDFAETERFVEWTLGLRDAVESITVLPYVFFLSAQDPTLGGPNRGHRRGVLWHTDAPGGDPAVRARRFMRLFELIGERVPVNSPIPPYLALPAMLPNEDPARADAWMKRYGRSFDQLSSSSRNVVQRLDPRFADACERARHVLETSTPDAGWTLDRFAWMGGSAQRGLTALFHRAGARFALLLEPVNKAGAAFVRTREFNVVYLKQWEGQPCGFDSALMSWCVRTIQRTETTAAAQ